MFYKIILGKLNLLNYYYCISYHFLYLEFYIFIRLIKQKILHGFHNASVQILVDKHSQCSRMKLGSPIVNSGYENKILVFSTQLLNANEIE